MKKILTSILASIGIVSGVQSQTNVQMIDPKAILYSVPTLSNDLAPLEPVSGKPANSDVLINEDDWSQVEFFPKTQLSNIQSVLKEFKSFELANRTKSGWRNVYVRKIDRKPLLSGAQAVKTLATLLEVKEGAAPIIFTSSALSGRVKSGFTFPLGGKIHLYGYTTNDGIQVLGASVGKDPDDSKLTQAFKKLNALDGLILVDWKAQLILISQKADGQIEVWRP